MGFSIITINQPSRKQWGRVVLNKELQPEFNTFLTASRLPTQAGSWVLNPLRTNKSMENLVDRIDDI
jgi:hypothetical protein